MEGNLKKKLSFLKGYTDQWFVLKTDGYLQYYNQKPATQNQKPKGQMLLLLSDTIVKKDPLSFKIISAINEKYSLRADDPKKRDKWMKAINDVRAKLYNKMFKGFYDNPVHERVHVKKDTEEENEEGIFEEKTLHSQDDNHEMSSKTAIETDIASLFQKKKKPFLAVAAIDFGTTYSGCAFSTVEQFKRDPLSVVPIAIDDKNTFSYKTPTVLLLTPEGRFHSFGTKAEDHYTSLAEKNDAQDWYYFNRFKMQLYKNKELKSNMILKDMSGKTMKAQDVFAICIEFIRDKVLERLQLAYPDLDDEDVHWVLTVPAIWNDQARQFMIHAAEKAGIEKQYLSLALEPEAAAMCCKYLALEKKKKGDHATELQAFESGARFTVVDLGGGTIDITVSEVLPTGQLKEIYNATGGPWGGNFINDQIIKTLQNVMGWQVLQKHKAEELDEYLDLLRNVEQRKRSVKYKHDLELKISKDFSKKIRISDKFAKDVKTSNKALVLSASLIQSIFKSSLDKTIKHVEDLLSKEETQGVSTILLVGGYAASDFVQRAFREKFEKKFKIMFPLNSDMVVLKGAVVSGHITEAVVGRVAKYHYGLALMSSKVLGRTVSLKEGKQKSFFSLIKKGQKIEVGDVATKYEIVVPVKSDLANVEVYTTEEDTPPTYIDDSHFTRVGNIHIKLPCFRDQSVLILTISYDETEFKVVATDKNTGRCFVGICQFLEKDIGVSS